MFKLLQSYTNYDITINIKNSTSIIRHPLLSVVIELSENTLFLMLILSQFMNAKDEQFLNSTSSITTFPFEHY